MRRRSNIEDHAKARHKTNVVTNNVTANDLMERIESIRNQVRSLFLLHYMFWEVQRIVKNNDKLSDVRNQFFDWMTETFAISAGLYVRRQVDTRRDTVSFHRLLNDLNSHPLLITREYFVNKWAAPEGDPFRKQTVVCAEELFDEYVGAGKTHLEKGLIQADIKRLVETCGLVKTFADDYYAHISANPLALTERPKFSHLTDCMKCLEALLQKYYLLIKGQELISISDVEDSFTYPWREIFTIPWIEEDDATRI